MSKFPCTDIDGDLAVQLVRYRRTKRPLKITPIPLLGTRERNYINKAFEDKQAVNFICANCPDVVLSDQPTPSVLASKTVVKDCYDRLLLVPERDVMIFRMRFDPFLKRV